MHRRKRIRKQLMPSLMDIDGGGSKPHVDDQTNIETLTDQLKKISLKSLSIEQKKKKKPKYIDTSKLLTFRREKSY